jgi:tetratricopeptide (TPR) repeat protein
MTEATEATGGPGGIAAPPPSRRAWILWAAGAALFVAALGACSVYNYDTGMHLAKGRWICEGKGIPRPEEFTVGKAPGFTYKDRWLFTVGCWLSYRAGGWNGLIAVKILGLLAMFALLWRAARPAGPVACAAATLACALLMYERWDIRAELSVHFFVAAALALVATAEDGRRRWICGAPALSALAMNFHALCLLVPVLFAASAVAALVRAETRPLARDRALAAAGAFAACLLNPQGWRIFQVPFEYLHRYRTGPDWYRGWITELDSVSAPVEWPSVALRAVWIVPPLAAALCAVRWKKLPVWDIVLVGLGLLAAYSVRRNVAAAGVLLFPVIARGLHQVGAAICRGPLATKTGLIPAIAVGFPLFITALLSTSNLWSTSERSSRRAGLGLNRLALPADACDFLDRHNLSGHAFVNWDAGGFYAFRRSPASLPAMTMEGDFNLDNLREYDEVVRDPEKHFEAYASTRGIHLALLTHQSADTRGLIAWLARHDGWRCVWRDACAVVFARESGPDAATVRTLREAPDPPGLEPLELHGGVWPWSEGSARGEAVRAFRLGSMLALFGDSRARDLYRHAVSLWPGYPEAHSNLGATMAQANEPGADEEFRQAIRLAPRYVPARRNLALWHLNRRDAASAERVLREALEAREHADLLLDLAEILLVWNPARGQEEAMGLVERAMELRPGDARGQRLREAWKKK